MRGPVAVVLAMLAAGCYDPEVQDCTVRCEKQDTCAEGQVCDRDGWCASPDVAGQCGERRDDACVADDEDCEPGS